MACERGGLIGAGSKFLGNCRSKDVRGKYWKGDGDKIRRVRPDFIYNKTAGD